MNARRTIYQRKVKLNVSRLTEPGDRVHEALAAGMQSACGVTEGKGRPPSPAANV